MERSSKDPKITQYKTFPRKYLHTNVNKVVKQNLYIIQVYCQGRMCRYVCHYANCTTRNVDSQEADSNSLC